VIIEEEKSIISIEEEEGVEKLKLNLHKNSSGANNKIKSPVHKFTKNSSSPKNKSPTLNSLKKGSTPGLGILMYYWRV